MSEEGKQASLTQVQGKFLTVVDKMLDDEIEKGNGIDPKVMTELFRFMSSTKISDSETPAATPELTEAQAKAKKLLKQKKERKEETE